MVLAALHFYIRFFLTFFLLFSLLECSRNGEDAEIHYGRIELIPSSVLFGFRDVM